MDDVKQRVENIESVNRRIVATLVRLEGKIDDMGERMATEMATKDDISRVMAHIDGLVARYDDVRFRHAVHADTLKSHDERLTKLEKRRS